MPKLKVMNFGGWETLVNKDVAVAPYFSSLLRKRVHRKQATNCVITGEAGEGKSYQSTDIARILEGVTKSGKDRFTLKQVVYFYSQHLDLTIWLAMGRPIVFDEPSYAMGKRDWYKDINKALVLTIESQRFKVHPFFMPIINKSLLDKTIRSYLIQYQIEMRKRGYAVVYRIYPSQHTEKIYRYELCRLRYQMFDQEYCQRDSCLDCNELLECKLFRARYERRKASVQTKRYESAREKAQRKEASALTNDQIERILYPYREKFTKEDDRIDATLMRIVAREDFGIVMGNNRGYEIAKAMKYHHPEDFA